jgi:hypothetical protein
MVELVTIPVSFFEVAIDYERPDVRLLSERPSIVQGLVEALLQWNFKIDDIEILTGGKLSEQGAMFKIPQKNVSFFIGATLCRFSRNAVDWDLADETIAILDAVVSALTRLSGVVMGTKRTAVGVHLQPRTVPFMEILRPFVPLQLAAIGSQPIVTMATVARWGDRRITIDGSAVVANAVFLKLEREFLPSTSYQEITKRLWDDEQEVFAIMGVKEDRQ